MSLLIMAMAARRLLALSIALAFLISATAQLVPCGMAESDMGASAGMSAASGLPESPAPAHTPLPPAFILRGNPGASECAGLAPHRFAVDIGYLRLTVELARRTVRRA